MRLGIKLWIFAFSALLLDLVLLTLISLRSRNDLLTGQMIGLFVVIALVTCIMVGVATYRHLRTDRSVRILRWTVSVVILTVLGSAYSFDLFRFIERTNHSATGWHWLEFSGLLERLVLIPLLFYVAFGLHKTQPHESGDSAQRPK
jgi:hypothetical protein